MKKLIVSSVLAFITFSAQAAAFQVTSNEIKTGEQLTTSHVFSGFGCEGGNTSPSLTSGLVLLKAPKLCRNCV